MSINDALNSKTLELRKSRDELAGSFQVTLAQAVAFAKERGLKTGDFTVTEDDAARAIQKSIKQVRDTLALVPTDTKSLRELEILESLLPRAATTEDLDQAMDDFLAKNTDPLSMKLMGPAMKHVVDLFGPALDKALASKVIKDRLS